MVFGFVMVTSFGEKDVLGSLLLLTLFCCGGMAHCGSTLSIDLKKRKELYNSCTVNNKYQPDNQNYEPRYTHR